MKELDEKLKKEEKTNKTQFERMMRFEEKCKELKAINEHNNPVSVAKVD